MYLNLKLELWRKGIRQNQLAQMLHMDESLLSKIVNGFRAATPELRGRITELLASNEQWLFEDDQPTVPTIGVHDTSRTLQDRDQIEIRTGNTQKHSQPPVGRAETEQKGEEVR